MTIYFSTFIALLLSKGLALIPALGLDDYVALHVDRNPQFYLLQGRFTQALVQIFLTHLGIPPTSITWPVVLLFFGFAAASIAFGLIYVAKSRGNVWALAAIGAAIAAHPYLTEYFSFRESLITQGLSFALLAGIFAVTQYYRPINTAQNVGKTAIILVLMILLAGAQQTTFIILGFFILAQIVQDHLDSSLHKSKSTSKQDRLLAIYLVAAVCYMVIYELIKRLSGGAHDPRSSFVAANELGTRAHLVLLLTRKLLLSSEPTLSLLVKVTAFLTFLLYLILATIKRPVSLPILGATAIVLYFGSIFLVAISGAWWPVPRALYGFGFAVGILLLLVHMNAESWAPKMFSILVFIAAIGFSFHSSFMLYDQMRLNRWDSWVASSLATELIQLGSTDQRVVLVNAPWEHEVGLKTNDGDLNLSALAVPWAVNHLFMEITGRKWKIDSLRSATECDGINPWPAKEAIRPINGVTYICLGK
ncbi:hypothetical protein [Achromobacter aloeverae]